MDGMNNITDDIMQTIRNSTTESLLIYVILNKLNDNREIIDDSSIERYGAWIQYDYEFNRPISCEFILHSINTKKKYQYTNVLKLTLIQFMNVYTQCKLYQNDENQYEHFYILNDVHKLEFNLL